LYYSFISSIARDHYVYDSLSLHDFIRWGMYHCISGLQVNSRSIAASKYIEQRACAKVLVDGLHNVICCDCRDLLLPLLTM